MGMGPLGHHRGLQELAIKAFPVLWPLPSTLAFSFTIPPCTLLFSHKKQLSAPHKTQAFHASVHNSLQFLLSQTSSIWQLALIR